MTPTFEQLKLGTRVARTSYGSRPTPLEVGSPGTVVKVDQRWCGISVDWDIGSRWEYSPSYFACLEIITEEINEWEGNLELE